MLVTITCEYCGDAVEYDKRGRYVRRTCFAEACVRERTRDLLFSSRQRGDAPIEKFRRRDIFERDNWACYLCGGPTDRGVAPSHALTPTIEHVHSRRGGHTRANCRTAHMVCNERKRTHFYDLTLGALVVTPGSTFLNDSSSYPVIEFVVGEWARCPDCDRSALRSPSGLLAVGPLPHGSPNAPCPDATWIDHAAEGEAIRHASHQPTIYRILEKMA